MRRSVQHSIVVVLAIFSFTLDSSASIFYVDALSGADTNNGLYQTYQGGQDGPKQTISNAINDASDGDTIMVAAGTYPEAISITKALVLLGNNYGTSPSGPRGSESIILPESINFDGPPASFNSMIVVDASLVEISGFMLNGDNPAEISGNTVDTADVDIGYGIISPNSNDLVTIKNNIFVNLNTCGVYLGGSAGVANIPGFVDQCDFSNFNTGSIGVWCIDDFLCNVNNNSFSKVDDGIVMQNFTSKTAARIFGLRGNTIAARNHGILMSDFATRQISIAINKNRISSDSMTIAEFGVSLLNLSDSANVKTNSNVIVGVETGIFLGEMTGLPFISIQDTITNVKTGIHLHNTLTNPVTTEIDISYAFIDTFSSNGVMVLAEDNDVKFALANSQLMNGDNALKVLGNCEVSFQQNAMSNIATDYIHLGNNGNGSAPTIGFDVSGSSFEGVLGGNVTIAEGLAIEDKLMHYLDTGSFAAIGFNPGHVYVTTNHGNTSLGRALDISGDNFNIYMNEHHSLEQVTVVNTINLYPQGDLSLGSVSMDGNGKELILHGDLALRTGLDLSNGNINTANGTLTLGHLDSAEVTSGITGGNSGSYVDGVLYQVNFDAASDTLFFPIGSNGDYRPMSLYLTFKGASDTSLFAGSTYIASPSAIPVEESLSHVSEYREWLPRYMGTGSVDEVFYSLEYATSTNDDGVVDAPNLRIAGDDGSVWENLGGSGSADGNGTIESTSGADDLSVVRLANASAGANFMGVDRAIAGFDFSSTCVYSPTQFTDQSLSNGGNIVKWHWNFGVIDSTNDTSNLETPAYIYQEAGQYTVTLNVTNANGGSSSVQKTVTITPLPEAEFGVTIPCFPEPLTMNNTSTISTGTIDAHEWKVDTFIYSAKNITPTLPDTGTYNIELVVTSDNGCTDTSRETVFYGDSVKISFTPPGPVSKCDYNTINVGVLTPYTSYLWNTGDTTNSVTADAAGYYVLTAQTSRHCFGTDSILVINIPRPNVEAGPNKLVKYGDLVQLEGSGEGTLTWSPDTYLDDVDIATPSGRPLKSMQYVLTAVNAGGCVNSDSVQVDVFIPDYIRINNLITPNNDGKNDVWNLVNVPDLDQATVVIMSRWGQEVFRQEGYNNTWDGTNEDGNPLPEGTYIYIIDVKGDNPIMYKGSIEIIR